MNRTPHVRTRSVLTLCAGLALLVACTESSTAERPGVTVPMDTPAVPVTEPATTIDRTSPPTATAPPDTPPPTAGPGATNPPDTVAATLPPATIPPGFPPGVVALHADWFAQPADPVIRSLEELGLVVVDYVVCSGSVAAGEVRQIIASDGTVLLDRDGPTDAARSLDPGSVVEVKIGSGTAC